MLNYLRGEVSRLLGTCSIQIKEANVLIAYCKWGMVVYLCCTLTVETKYVLKILLLLSSRVYTLSYFYLLIVSVSHSLATKCEFRESVLVHSVQTLSSVSLSFSEQIFNKENT